MRIAILTFDGFNDLDSLIALGILNRVKKPDWRVTLSCPTPCVTSMNGVTLNAQSTLADACAADAVIVGSGIRTREIANAPMLMVSLKPDPTLQLIGAQGHGGARGQVLSLASSRPTASRAVKMGMPS